MHFLQHTFELSPKNSGTAFAFHESIAEGQSLYFLGKFHTPERATDQAETLFATIVDHIKNSNIHNAYDCFEEALKAVNHKAKEIILPDEKAPEVVIAYFDFHQLYLTQSVGTESYLLRDQSVSQISENLENQNDLFINILSGQVALDDTIIISNTNLLNYLSGEELAQAFEDSDFAAACRALHQKLESHDISEGVFSCVGIGKNEKTLPKAAGFLSQMVSKGEQMVKAKTSQETKKSDEEILTTEAEDLELPSPQKKSLQKLAAYRPDQAKVKTLLYIGGALFLFLLLRLFIGFVGNYESAEEKVMGEKIDIARQALQQADSFLVQGEREAAREYITQAETALQYIMSSDSKTYRSDAQYLYADVNDKKLMVENAKKVTPTLLSDLGVKNDNIDALNLLDLRGNLFVTTSKVVYKTVRNIVENGVTLSEKETVVAAATREDQNTLLFLTATPRIIEYRDGVVNPMNTTDEAWKQGVDIQTYGRFAYVLDPSENQIWKYERRRTGYSGASAYNQDANLADTISFTIDGSIYLLGADGGITKLFRGKRTDYNWQNLPSVEFVGNKLRIYTSAELDSLYVLDPDNARILVFAKGDRYATYRKQILYDLEDVRDFTVDSSGQKAQIMTKDKIYTISL